MAANGSRFILGHLRMSDYARLEDDQEAIIVLNPAEPNARAEASKGLKAVYAKAGRRCVISSQSILVESEPGVWNQSHFLKVRPVPLNHVEK
ncbi:hypothetical protein ACFQDN_21615 [Pseudomonas asuensis]|uniref:Uncharacterized protein n=1 Tax=Pseudomonas asuensis TaxID=1825787 RepID=A0ABQ2H357_9PSED|nr:hypothetical protein [Pseudomonas asuensis]GGM26364.1 hypothetical protein GCM10009425_41260 [Pseudomonas asuensis]